MRDEPEPFECDGHAKAETERALLLVLETGQEIWAPKSVIHEDSEVFRKGDSGKVIIKGWWANKEGLS